MPGSFPVFDEVVRQLVAWLAPSSALDVGAGAGKYGHLLRQVVPECDRTAVEVHEAYVEQYGLRDVYARVAVDDIRNWHRCNEQENFDLVLVGDCLQHLPKSDGVDFLNAMVYRSAWLLVLVPEFVVQGPGEATPHEVHRSVWSERDFHWHDLWAWDNARAMTLLLLRGYRASATTLDAIVGRLNDDVTVPLLDFDGQSRVRPCRLRLIDHAREVAYRPR
jgi:hypothetical protein